MDLNKYSHSWLRRHFSEYTKCCLSSYPDATQEFIDFSYISVIADEFSRDKKSLVEITLLPRVLVFNGYPILIPPNKRVEYYDFQIANALQHSEYGQLFKEWKFQFYVALSLMKKSLFRSIAPLIEQYDVKISDCKVFYSSLSNLIYLKLISLSKSGVFPFLDEQLGNLQDHSQFELGNLSTLNVNGEIYKSLQVDHRLLKKFLKDLPAKSLPLPNKLRVKLKSLLGSDIRFQRQPATWLVSRLSKAGSKLNFSFERVVKRRIIIREGKRVTKTFTARNKLDQSAFLFDVLSLYNVEGYCGYDLEEQLINKGEKLTSTVIRKAKAGRVKKFF